MTMKRVFVAVAACVLGGLCVIGVNSRAEARGSGAMAGSAALGADHGCFSEFAGGVRNECAIEKAFVLPLVYDNAGGITIQVAARGLAGTARQVRCRAYSIGSDGGGGRISSLMTTQLHTGVTEYLKLPINAHGWGGTYAYCGLDPSTVIRNFHY